MEEEIGVFQFTEENTWAFSPSDLWFNPGIQTGVYRFDDGKLKYLRFPIPPQSKMLDHVTGFSRKTDHIWIATYNGVLGYDGTTFTIISNSTLSIAQKGPLHVRSILEDSKGRLWIGNNGIRVLLQEQDSLINFLEQQGLIHAESSYRGHHSPGTLEHVFAITEDKEGNIWFSDRDNGPWKFDNHKMTNYVVDPNLASQVTWHIYQNKEGQLLFAMTNGAVYAFDGKNFERHF